MNQNGTIVIDTNSIQINGFTIKNTTGLGEIVKNLGIAEYFEPGYHVYDRFGLSVQDNGVFLANDDALFGSLQLYFIPEKLDYMRNPNLGFKGEITVDGADITMDSKIDSIKISLKSWKEIPSGFEHMFIFNSNSIGVVFNCTDDEKSIKHIAAFFLRPE